MRKIKFRAWDEKEKKMIDWEWLEIYDPDGFRVVDVEGVVHHPEGTLMQFTGLKDKNGKEIYEGDIIKWGFGSINEEPNIDSVKWSKRLLAFILKEDKHSTRLLCDPTETEIIGNIYENPELLEGK